MEFNHYNVFKLWDFSKDTIFDFTGLNPYSTNFLSVDQRGHRKPVDHPLAGERDLRCGIFGMGIRQSWQMLERFYLGFRYNLNPHKDQQQKKLTLRSRRNWTPSTFCIL
ncbi:hypothetical protein JCM18916_640 [Cutibacterium acnes JCM 18916]|nr:hypothetical protein JCM18916_640 [Cutibacterium acnes JCM 18916]